MPTFSEPDASEVSSHLMMLGWLSGLYFVKTAAALRAASSAACCEAGAAFFVQRRDASLLSRGMLICGIGHGSDDLLEIDE